MAIALLQFVPIDRAFGACHPSDFHKPQLHAPAAVAQLGSGRARNLCNLAHDASQHPNSIPQQSAVGRVVDVGLHHSRVHTHPSSRGYTFVSGYCHDPRLNLLEHLRTERQAPAAHRLRIWRLGAAHMGKVPIYQVGAHLALQHLIAPIEDQQSQHHVGRRATATATTALGMSFCQGLVHDRDNLLVRKHRIGVLHPVFTQIAHLLGNQSVAEAELGSTHVNHAASLALSKRPVLAGADHD